MGGLSEYLSKNYGNKPNKKKSKQKARAGEHEETKKRSTVLDDTLIADATRISHATNSLNGESNNRSLNPVVSRLVLKKSKVERSTAPEENNEDQHKDQKKDQSQEEVSGTEPKNLPEFSTVYRDSRGRKIEDVDKYLEMRNQKEEEIKLRKTQFHEKDNMAEDQRLAKIKLEKDLQRVAKLKTNVTRDDESLNKEMKSKILEDDPLLAMSSLLGKPMSDSANGYTASRNSSSSGRKLYSGKSMIPYNRFNMVPGYRWDGIDRSNGFEIRVSEKQYETQERRSHRQAAVHDDLDFDDD